MLREAFILAVLVSTPGLAHAQDVATPDPAVRFPAQTTPRPRGNFESRMNEFMVVRCKDHPEWWKDQRMYQGGAIPAGFLLVKGVRGDLLIRVKAWSELTPGQKEALCDDPFWAAFLRAKRDKAVYPGSSTIYANAPVPEGQAPMVGLTDDEQPAAWNVTIDPGELVRRRPVEIRLAAKREGAK